MTDRPPKAATARLLARLESARRLAGLRVHTLALAVEDLDDLLGWARLTELGTRATTEAQQAAIDAVSGYLADALTAAGVPGPAARVPIQPGVLGSGRDVRGMFATTRSVVERRMRAGATWADARDASATYLTGVASSEPHRIGRDGQLAVGLADERFNRFRRVAEPDACDFCKMLATRGAVYLTADTAGEHRRYHTSCRCHIELVADPAAIAASKALSDDWRTAISDPPRMQGAGAMRPDPADKAAWRQYWDPRQDATGATVASVGRLEPEEIEFIERFQARGHRLEWLPTDPKHRPVDDFLWLDNESLPIELKSPRTARYKTIRGRIEDHVIRATRQGVVKENFVVDLGLEPLTEELRLELAGYNEGRRKYRIARLWVMGADGTQFDEIRLRE